MPSKPWDLEVINTREQLITNDFNISACQAQFALREFLRQFVTPSTTSSNPAAVDYLTPYANPTPARAYALGSGLRVTAEPVGASLVVHVNPGTAFQWVDFALGTDLSIGGVGGLDDREGFRVLYLSADQAFTVPSTTFIGRRVDLIEVRFRNELTDLMSRNIGVLPSGFVPDLVPKTLTRDLLGMTGVVNAPDDSTAYLSYKVGVVNPGGGAATVPSVTSGYAPLCEIWILGGSTPVITYRHVADRRHLLAPHGINRASFQISKACNASAYEAGTLIGAQIPPSVWIVDAVPTGANNMGACCSWAVLVPGREVKSYNVTVQISNAAVYQGTGPFSILVPQVYQEDVRVPTQGTEPAPDGPFGLYALIINMSALFLKDATGLVLGFADGTGDAPDPVIYDVTVEWF